ncbi:MAG: hypothetical protein ACOCZ8_04875 [Bacteroidota bacterium]
MRVLLFCLLLAVSALHLCAQDTLHLYRVEPIPVAHAHNDYLHQRPLIDALENGFTSIEVDVYLRKSDRLLVAHWPTGTWFNKRPIEELYLSPLLTILEKNGGRIYPDRTLLLYVDFKNRGAEAYMQLRELLKPLRPYLTRFHNGQVEAGAITVILTGHAPNELVLAQQERWCALDGGLGDLDEPQRSVYHTPVVSAKWQSVFDWNGKRKPMPPKQLARLKTYVRRAAEKGMRLRFYHTPERERLWRTLVENGMTLINTDELQRFNAWWHREGKQNPF